MARNCWTRGSTASNLFTSLNVWHYLWRPLIGCAKTSNHHLLSFLNWWWINHCSYTNTTSSAAPSTSSSSPLISHKTNEYSEVTCTSRSKRSELKNASARSTEWSTSWRPSKKSDLIGRVRCPNLRPSASQTSQWGLKKFSRAWRYQVSQVKVSDLCLWRSKVITKSWHKQKWSRVRVQWVSTLLELTWILDLILTLITSKTW